MERKEEAIKKIIDKIMELEYNYRDFTLKEKNGVIGQNNCKKREELEKKLDKLRDF